MRWKVMFFKPSKDECDEEENGKNSFGLKSDKCPPPVKELIKFEEDLFNLVNKIKFRKSNNNFQRKLKSDIKNIKNSSKTLTPADKTSNLYRLTNTKYNQLLQNSVTKTYKKINTKIDEKINEEGKILANKKNILNKINKNGKDECFITLKDHKDNFENNPTTRLINPAKNELGRVNKVLLQNINKHLRNLLKLQQWNNTSTVINWFSNINEKHKHKFMVFDIKEFYPSISKSLLDKCIEFAKQHINISDEDINIINHARKSLLYCKGESWIKNNNELFDVTMGAYDGAEVCELVGLFLLNEISKNYNKNNVGLYRDDGLAIFKDINGHQADKIRKDFHKIFKDQGLDLVIECNIKITNFLDVTFNLEEGTYKPFKKPNDETIYIHTKSNHPKNILKQLPLSVESRLSNLSSIKEIFDENAKYYQEILNKCEYNHTLTYIQSNHNNLNKNNSRKRKIIWFNPPYSTNVSTNVGKYFLNLISKHFPKDHIYNKIFNKNNLKVSYSCMPNMKSVINSHNKNIINSSNEPSSKCNCVDKSKCPLNNECLTKNIVYKATVTTDLANYNEKSYIGICEGPFKLRYANHKKSISNKKYLNETELSKEIWKIKAKNGNPVIKFSILKKCAPYNSSSNKCSLCINEKLFILENSHNDILLNQRNELVSKCRHRNKHKLSNHKT